jgi:hypothetical protein
MKNLIELLRRIARAGTNLGYVSALASLNCCGHPSQARKPRWRRYLDLVYMAVRWGEPSTLYYAQQLDLKGRSIREYLAYPSFRHYRDIGNRYGVRIRSFDYACLLQDKLVFERYFAAARVPTAPILGTVSQGLVGMFPVDSGKAVDFWEYGQSTLRSVPLFCKPRLGIKGAGVFSLRFESKGAFLNGRPATREDLLSAFDGSEYIVQPKLEQHRAIAAFHEHSLNTIRFITFRADEGIEIFLAYLRMGASGQINDNNNASRAIARIDATTGRLYDLGYAIEGEIASLSAVHPSTGTEFRATEVPWFQKCCDLVLAAHELVPRMQSIGWDVAITPEGPVLLEGNDDWGATTALWMMPDFPQQFLRRTRSRG